MERAFTRVMPLLIMVSALHSVDLTWRIGEFFFNCFHCQRQSVKKKLLKSIGMQPANWLFSADVFIKKIPFCGVFSDRSQMMS